MKLSIHQDAADNYNRRAKEILLKMGPVPIETSKKEGFSPDTPVTHTLTSADIIGEPQLELCDSFGNTTAKCFWHNGAYIGLSENDFRELLKLSQSFQLCKEIKPRVSHEFLTNTIFDWLKGQYGHLIQEDMTVYVLDKIEKAVEIREIWIPIFMLHVQSPIKIGHIVVKPITKERFDGWITTIQSKVHRDMDQIIQMLEQQRKRFQGLAAATIELTAEPKRAAEIAFEETEKSISLLRLFHPANLHPKLTSYCVPFGRDKLASDVYLVMKEGMLGEISEHILDKSGHWAISDAKVKDGCLDGLTILSTLLEKEELTDFQDRLLSALLLYSKNNLEREPAPKLLYIFAALESLLLKNANEAIEQNIGERMALLIGKGVDVRQEIIQNVKKAYALRSRFIHHGRSIEDYDVIETFMMNVWILFNNMIRESNNFKSCDDMVELVERMKLS